MYVAQGEWYPARIYIWKLSKNLFWKQLLDSCCGWLIPFLLHSSKEENEENKKISNINIYKVCLLHIWWHIDQSVVYRLALTSLLPQVQVLSTSKCMSCVWHTAHFYNVSSHVQYVDCWEQPFIWSLVSSLVLHSTGWPSSRTVMLCLTNQTYHYCNPRFIKQIFPNIYP